ncbi:MAG: glycerate kinase [Arenicellales bacterium]
MDSPRIFLRQLLDAAIASAQSDLCLPPFVPNAVKGKTVVVGAGKASASMARTFEQHFKGELSGLVVTQYGYAVPCKQVEIIEAAHPSPDAASLTAATRILDIAQRLGENDQLICLISGGGSALLALPFEGISLAEKQSIGAALLDGGATISEINCVRRHLSAIKGGRLAKAAYPAKMHTLLISDVPGDAPENIASGPSVADDSTCAQALDILKQYKAVLSSETQNLLVSGASETIKSSHACFQNNLVQLIATPQMALEAAALLSEQHSVDVMIFSDRLEGEARDVGVMLAEQALQVSADNHTPTVMLSGGETTVTVNGTGKGGRNVECLLAMAIRLNGQQNCYALAADTDGIDGKEKIAGAIITPSTLKRAQKIGLNPQAYLDNNDAHTFFTALGDSVMTGPTHTNVNDFRAVLNLSSAP